MAASTQGGRSRHGAEGAVGRVAALGGGRFEASVVVGREEELTAVDGWHVEIATHGAVASSVPASSLKCDLRLTVIRGCRRCEEVKRMETVRDTPEAGPTHKRHGTVECRAQHPMKMGPFSRSWT
jgi:hypothetical protein